MMKREPGFMGLAKQNARKKPMSKEQQQFRQQLGQEMQADRAQEQGMVDKMSAFNRMQQDKQRMMEVPQEYEPSQGGEMESLAYVNPKEMQMLKRSGGSGEMTEYGVPSFSPQASGNYADESTPSGPGMNVQDMGGNDGGDGGGSSGGGGQTQAQKDAAVKAKAAAAEAKAKQEAEVAAEKAAKEKVKTDREKKREGYVKEYEGYKGEYKGLGSDAKDITGEFGRTAGEMEDYAGTIDPETGERTGGFAGLGKDIRAEGEAGQDYFQGAVDPETGERTGGAAVDYKGAATTGAGELSGLGKGVMTDASGKTADQEGYDSSSASMQGGYKQVTGQGMADAGGRGETAAGVGAKGFETGAQDVADVQKRFGEEGFEKDVSGYESKIAQMGEKAMSGDVGQSQAAMLKGQMEEGRMASQKGSEEKLRRSMAQSGASPSEIASKVAQFQKQSAGQQAQAGRSEALSSQLQGQQMGQSQMGQAAGLMGQGAGMAGQRAGMAGQQASLGAQQAALRGQGAAMNMQGAQMGMQGAQGQQNAQLASLQGQAAMAQGAAGMNMQGVQGAAGLYGQGQASAMQGMQGQGQMMGQGLGALQAATGARGQQMAGVGVQAGMVGEQAGMTQAQLNDVMAQQTQAYQAEQAEKQRLADAAASSGGGGGGGGGILGGITSALGISDIRLKDNISLIKEGKEGDPNIYSFNYIWDSETLWSGVMAQELLDTKHADAVKTHANGYYMVDYHKLGIPMTQIST